MKVKFYHMTNHKNLNSIRENGLVIPPTGAPFIWLFEKECDARMFFSEYWDTLLEVGIDVELIQVSEDPHKGFAGFKTMIVRKSIPKEYIRLIEKRYTIW
jgi:hypothetical protein